jgi:hypothetical protein
MSEDLQCYYIPPWEESDGALEGDTPQRLVVDDEADGGTTIASSRSPSRDSRKYR